MTAILDSPVSEEFAALAAQLTEEPPKVIEWAAAPEETVSKLESGLSLMTVGDTVDAFPTARQLAEISESAAECIERYGHIKGSYGSVDHGVCAMGAIALAASASKLGMRTECIAYSAIADMLALETRYASVPEWNDAPERTPAEVTKALRSVAQKYRNS